MQIWHKGYIIFIILWLAVAPLFENYTRSLTKACTKTELYVLHKTTTTPV